MQSIKWASLFGAFGALALTCASAYSQPAPRAPVKTTSAYEAFATGAYWTEERRNNAQPMSMGRVPMLGVQPEMYGTQGLDFTSSRINPVSASKVKPHYAVGKLFFTIGSSDFVCSASVLRARLIVTAGHCLHSGNGAPSGYYSNWAFYPGFGSGAPDAWPWAAAIVSSPWYNGGGGVPNAEDWGIIQLADHSGGQKIATKTGKFDYLTNRLLDNHLTMLGYPVGFDGGQRMHHCSSSDFADNGTNTGIYGCDMTGGSSGGPWVQNFGVYSSGQPGTGFWPEPNRIVGVTSYGPVDTNRKYIGASIFNTNFTSLLSIMCNFTPGNC